MHDQTKKCFKLNATARGSQEEEEEAGEAAVAKQSKRNTNGPDRELHAHTQTGSGSSGIKLQKNCRTNSLARRASDGASRSLGIRFLVRGMGWLGATRVTQDPDVWRTFGSVFFFWCMCVWLVVEERS